MSAPKTCGWCGTRTDSIKGVCLGCAGTEANSHREPEYEHGLYGGRWVRRGLTQVWEQQW